MKSSVLLISHGFQPNYEKAFANGLARNGVDIELIGSDRTLYYEMDSSVSAINLRGSQDPGRSRIRKALNYIRYLSSVFTHIAASRKRALHLCGLLLGGVGPLALFELVLYRLNSRKLLLTVHNIKPHDKHEKTSRAVLNCLYRIPHVLVVHTSKMKLALMSEFGIDASRIVVMEHGVDDVPDLDFSLPNDSCLRALMFGNVSPYKGVDVFLRALSRCHGITIVATIAGDSRDEQYTDEISKLIAAVPKPHQVQWIRGFIPEEEVRTYFARADVVVMPYRHIDQSGVLFTSFRFGTPVICFPVGAFSEYVPKHAGIVLGGPSEEELAAGLVKFYEQRAAYDRKSIQDYAKTHSWDNTVVSLLPYLN